MDYYKTYKSLLENCNYETDYIIDTIDNLSPVSIISIHGGGIEPGTTEISKLLAERGSYKYFSFIANRHNQLGCKENEELHVTSNNFTDNTCLNIVGNSIATISIHGAADKDNIIFIGGKNYVHKEFITYELILNGFNVSNNTPQHLSGLGVNNICNRNMRNMGVQIELSQGFRKHIYGDDWKKKDSRIPNDYLNLFINCLYKATQKYINIP